MRSFTIREKIPCRSSMVAARYFLLRNRWGKKFGFKKMSQTAIANRLKVTPQCVHEVAKELHMAK